MGGKEILEGGDWAGVCVGCGSHNDCLAAAEGVGFRGWEEELYM